ncbi:T9SS-dependent choice-of-anchor J family protein [Riemerella columbina]|uniref:T9SS-dependent choice-of-anchor J family protein n=1 Tax=Riemerella columbina TaxID=103810 RepID=UPI00266FAD02|nr:T9SS type A sorting domain-containing protein [Riemerella columbina]WKS94862.1 T9SS type A sorting domain-containing protein [Riemerella columbina]
MKKLWIVALGLSLGSAHAQSFQENFDGLGVGLSQWVLYSDGGVPAEAVKDYQEPWVEKDMRLYNLNLFKKYAISTSYYEDEKQQADRWMVSPKIKITQDNHTLYWEEYGVDPYSPDAFKILIAENGGTTKADFTKEIYTTDQASDRPTFKSVDLQDYIGKEVRVAFVNHSLQGFLLGIDNIYVGGSGIENPNLLDYSAQSPSAIEMKWYGSKDVELYLGEYNHVPQPADQGIKVKNDYTVIDQLPAGTLWHAYIKDNKENAMWIGPYPVATAYQLPYSQDFEGDLLKGNIYVEEFSVVENKFFENGGQRSMLATSDPDDVTIKQFYLPSVFIPKGKQVNIKFDMLHLNNLAEPTVSLVTYDVRGNRFSYLWTTKIKDIDTAVTINEPIGTFQEDGTYHLALLYSTNYNETEDYNVLYIDNLQIGTPEELAVKEAAAAPEVHLYPNPATSEFRLSNADEVLSVEIYTVDGKRLSQQKASTSYSVADLPKGLYLVKINTKKGTVTQKLIKK